ncbi:hypothetical protein Bca101_013384 [Brassica carinata]
MSSPERKRKKKPSLKQSQVLGPTTPESSTQNPSLPDDLVVSCLARVSRLQYPTLSLVSKSFRSLLPSPHLYETRSSLDRTESCLYVCIRFSDETNPRWFTLCQKPDHTTTNKTQKKTKKSSSVYALAAIPFPHSPPAHWSGLVAVGSNIYNIGGSEAPPLSTVSILDCRSHTWREAPSMLIERYDPAASVVDGKIYVAGGCEECDNSSWMEVFDPKTQTWELVPSRGPEICGCKIFKSAVVDGKLYMFGTQNGLVYKPREEGRWERVGWEMDLGWPWFSYSVIHNVLFCYSDGFKWYDTEARVWRHVKGLKGLPKFASYGCVKLADYGGKMAVLWDKYLPSSGYKKKMIWCAVIALERPNSEEIWGKVEWLDAVLTVPDRYRFVCALVATV